MKPPTIIQLVWFQWKGCRVPHTLPPHLLVLRTRNCYQYYYLFTAKRYCRLQSWSVKALQIHKKKTKRHLVYSFAQAPIDRTPTWERTSLSVPQQVETWIGWKACTHCKNEPCASSSGFLGFLFCSSSVTSWGNAQRILKSLMWKQHYCYR